MTTWRTLIAQEMLDRDEKWGDVVAHTFVGHELDAPFDEGFGASEGCPLTLWTTHRVYFPVQYDGSEWCASVSRNPDGRRTDHVG